MTSTKRLSFPKLITRIIDTAAKHGASSPKLKPLKLDAARRIAEFDIVLKTLHNTAVVIKAIRDREKNRLTDKPRKGRTP